MRYTKYNFHIHNEHSKSEQTTDQHRHRIAVHTQREGEVKWVKGLERFLSLKNTYYDFNYNFLTLYNIFNHKLKIISKSGSNSNDSTTCISYYKPLILSISKGKKVKNYTKTPLLNFG